MSICLFFFFWFGISLPGNENRIQPVPGEQFAYHLIWHQHFRQSEVGLCHFVYLQKTLTCFLAQFSKHHIFRNVRLSWSVFLRMSLHTHGLLCCLCCCDNQENLEENSSRGHIEWTLYKTAFALKMHLLHVNSLNCPILPCTSLSATVFQPIFSKKDQKRVPTVVSDSMELWPRSVLVPCSRFWGRLRRNLHKTSSTDHLAWDEPLLRFFSLLCSSNHSTTSDFNNSTKLH